MSLLHIYCIRKKLNKLTFKKYTLIFIFIFIFLYFNQISSYAYENTFSLKNIQSINTSKDFSEKVIKEISLIKDKTHKNKVQAMIAFVFYESGTKTKFPQDQYSRIGWSSLYVYAKTTNHFNFDDVFILFRQSMKNNLDLFYCFSTVYFGEEIPLSYVINFKDMY